MPAARRRALGELSSPGERDAAARVCGAIERDEHTHSLRFIDGLPCTLPLLTHGLRGGWADRCSLHHVIATRFRLLFVYVFDWLRSSASS